MMYSVEPLDRRHTGHEYWQYRIYITQQQLSSYSGDRFRYFHQLRIWMTEQYGPSCERDIYSRTILAYKEYDPFDPPWCWHIDREKEYVYIYVKNETILSNFTLKWSA